MQHLPRLLAIITLAAGCADHRFVPSEDVGHPAPRLDASAPIDVASDPMVDAAQDAAIAIDAGPRDAGPHDAGALDAAVDSSTPEMCDPSACPDPTDLGKTTGDLDSPLACCVGDRCGAQGWEYWACHVLEVGSSDEDCLDADLSKIDGGVAPGCCRSDNTCGHFNEKLGCHRLFNYDWFPEVTSCDGAPEELGEGPFMCLAGEDDHCTYDWECCQHYNYKVLCREVGPFGRICDACPTCE